MTPKKPTHVWVTVGENSADGSLRRVQVQKPCIEARDGLAVVHIGCYRITHLATGKRISGDFDTPDAALALMEQVLPLTDWTQDAPNLDDSVNTALANFGAGPGTEVRKVQP